VGKLQTPGPIQELVEERDRYKRERDELLLKMAKELDDDAKQECSSEPLRESDGSSGEALGGQVGG
jgi:hypothetical protein